MAENHSSRGLHTPQSVQPIAIRLQRGMQDVVKSGQAVALFFYLPWSNNEAKSLGVGISLRAEPRNTERYSTGDISIASGSSFTWRQLCPKLPQQWTTTFPGLFEWLYRVHSREWPDQSGSGYVAQHFPPGKFQIVVVVLSATLLDPWMIMLMVLQGKDPFHVIKETPETGVAEISCSEKNLFSWKCYLSQVWYQLFAFPPCCSKMVKSIQPVVWLLLWGSIFLCSTTSLPFHISSLSCASFAFVCLLLFSLFSAPSRTSGLLNRILLVAGGIWLILCV